MDASSTPPPAHNERALHRRAHWIVPCVLVFAAAGSLGIDLPVARMFVPPQRPEALDRWPLRETVEICEAFGHGFGATLIMIAVGLLNPMKWLRLVLLAASSLGSGLVVDVLKLFIHRTRPRDFDWTMNSVWNTFGNESGFKINMQSFPSAHTATAVGLAVMLTALFPRGRWLFLVLAILVGMQRVVSSSHFPSDVFAGATVGWLVGILCVNSMTLPRQAPK